ncbi:hypothetical protein SAMD00019534_029360 [Acytostelium subglobosum LB1]|uniref:hypothetical protein n=1 Tax=Acytostelium subglobosum LB1 TaxID=1410327 RepID=UPI00064507CB|nr:hypothetical protein SAMD00019534_029360 [Acytostelium subglobosum LB1]GAM19761.1 hypothetical protein SAMD00019534_029360 [Acytostelium subglobosum LB1]|eukprot:XP_012756523.1 hypothetical protein SAMD00019534_029360 [Acytostelium subglobosum LB1]
MPGDRRNSNSGKPGGGAGTSSTGNNNNNNNNNMDTQQPQSQPASPPLSSLTKILAEEKKQPLSTLVDKEMCGDYILIDIIGKGGFGVVYKGLHKTKGHFSAIKKIKITKRKKGDKSAESQSMLMVEINLLKVLSHHNIVRYYDHIPTSSHSYIVMEFIENGSLEKIVKRHGLLPEGLVNVYIAQVLNGLEYLHRQGVIHRDIKAANLLIATDGSIKLADFGVATKVSDLSADNPDDSFAGTPYWMAPEMIQMQGVSTACDVWSLGCTIIELLSGQPPYFGLAPAAALYKIVQEDHPPIPQGISPALKDFLLQCFKKDENMRSSAKQLLNHPWIRAVAMMKNAEGKVKNARQEILTYNAQMQEVATIPAEQIVTRPRSKTMVPPLPLHMSNGQIKQAATRAVAVASTPAPASTAPATTTTQQTQKEQSKEKKAIIEKMFSKFVDDDDDDDGFGPAAKQQPQSTIKLKLQKFVDDEQDDGNDFFKSVQGKSNTLKVINKQSDTEWDDKGGFDGFSDDEDATNSNKKKEQGDKKELKLKVRDTTEEWDSEIEDSFDSVSMWSEEEDRVRTTINLQDKKKEHVTKTIVDLLSQLKPLLSHLQTTLQGEVASEETSRVIEKLIELLLLFPTEKRLLINNGEGGVYFRLPLITLLEILELPLSDGDHHYLILKLINQVMSSDKDILETICILNGIPIITTFAARRYPEELREEVSKFVLELCLSSSYSLNMFIAGSRGCKVLVDLVDSDYFNSSVLIHNALDSISQVFKLQSALPKTSLCHLFSRTELLNRISFLLYQIFIPTSTDTEQQLDHKNKIKQKSLSKDALHHSVSRSSSSVKLLPKDAFDRVLAYSVKAADILLFFSTGDSLVKEEMSSEAVLKDIREVLQEIYMWKSITKDVRAFVLRILKVIKNLSMDQNNRAKLDNVEIISTLIAYLGLEQGGIEKISEIYNQVLHSLYHLLLLDKSRQDKALKSGILPPLLQIINERGPLKELALPILFDLVRLSTSSSRKQLWECNTLDKLLVLLEDRNWFADAIESIAAWTTLESSTVYQRLTCRESALKLMSIVHVSHVKHPSFSKSLIPLLQLMQGSNTLIDHLVEVGLVPELLSCLRLDQSPVSRITLLKIVLTTNAKLKLNNITNNQQLTELKQTLLEISEQDESQIVKTIADNLLDGINNHNIPVSSSTSTTSTTSM